MADGPPGVAARRLALEALVRIDTGGAYANLVLPEMLERSDLEERDRTFVTGLVYGVTRRRRALDFLIDRFVHRDDVDPHARAALRLGAYQLSELGTPPHAAVGATVATVPRRARGFVNAVLRRVADDPHPGWPSEAIRLSYPDWIVDAVTREVGDRATAVLEAMNEPATTHVRDDGYRQDPASQAVADLVEVPAGGTVVDLCAAPGGKATAIAAGSDAELVVGADLHPHRARLVGTAAASTGTAAVVHPVVADGTRPPVRRAIADAVLVDAPCSGLGSLRRRPDARWRIQPDAIEGLADLQVALVGAAAELARPGGVLVYSVCTLTGAETVDVDARIADTLPGLVPEPIVGGPWESIGTSIRPGVRVLPDAFDGDGMVAFRYRVSDGATSRAAPSAEA